ncbi:MAG: tetratricopeptide repeat protein [Candidatus Saccharicenans sp.]
MKKAAIFIFCFLILFTTLVRAEALVPYEDGIKALNNKNYNQALEIFKKAVQKEGETGKNATFCSFFLGMTYYEMGQTEEAIKYFKRAIDIYRQGMTVFHLEAAWYFWLGRSYYRMGNYKEAIDNFKQSIPLAYEVPERAFDNYYKMFFKGVADRIKNAILPQMPPLDSCYFWLGNGYLSDGQYAEAVDAFNKAIQLKPNISSFYSQLGRAYLGLNEFEKALQATARSLQIDENNSYAYWVLSKIYSAMGKQAEAIGALKKSVELDPKDLDGYINLANLYREAGNYDESINTMKKAVEVFPKNNRANYYLVYDYLAAGRYDDALSAINNFIETNTIGGIGTYFTWDKDFPTVVLVEGTVPFNPAGLENGDEIIKINGQPTKGNKDRFFKILQSEPGTKVTLTIKRKNLKDPLEKTVTIEKVLMKSAAVPFALRSLIYSLKGNLEEARKDAEKAYSINPDDAWTWSAISLVYITEAPALTRSEKIDEALKILSRSKDNLDRLLEVLAYAKAGDFKQALQTYGAIPRQYLESNDMLRNSLRDAALEALSPYIESKKESAKSFVLKGEYQEALKVYEELLMISGEQEAKEIRSEVAKIIKARPDVVQLPEEARRYAMRAEMAIKEGRFAEALKEYQQALKISPFFPQLYKAIALTFEPMKEYRQAIKSMNIYLELYPDAPDAREAKDQIYK